MREKIRTGEKGQQWLSAVKYEQWMNKKRGEIIESYFTPAPSNRIIPPMPEILESEVPQYMVPDFWDGLNGTPENVLN